MYSIFSYNVLAYPWKNNLRFLLSGLQINPSFMSLFIQPFNKCLLNIYVKTKTSFLTLPMTFWMLRRVLFIQSEGYNKILVVVLGKSKCNSYNTSPDILSLKGKWPLTLLPNHFLFSHLTFFPFLAACDKNWDDLKFYFTNISDTIKCEVLPSNLYL